MNKHECPYLMKTLDSKLFTLATAQVTSRKKSKLNLQKSLIFNDVRCFIHLHTEDNIWNDDIHEIFTSTSTFAWCSQSPDRSTLTSVYYYTLDICCVAAKIRTKIVLSVLSFQIRISMLDEKFYRYTCVHALLNQIRLL